MSGPERGRTAPPETLAAADLHEAAWGVMCLLTELLAYGGWLSTTDLADRCGLGRDTVRRMLRTLECRAWVRRELAENRELWTIGPELPRIGVQFQELLVQRSAALRADFDHLHRPIEKRS